MHHPRCIIAGLSGGTGKTLVSLGIIRTLTLRGNRVKTFKKGPDYIDAAWLALASDTPQGNLDPFFCPPAQLRRIFLRGASGHDCAVIEGNRGLFDGLDAAGSCSTAELARTLAAPVILVVDCTKMTRTTAALIAGCANFEQGLHIGGVILNRTGTARQRALIRQAVETYTDVPVLGALPRHGAAHIQERRMGLAGTGSRAESLALLDSLAGFMAEHVDLDAVLRLMASAPGLEIPGEVRPASGAAPPASTPETALPRPRLGYALDEAFWFYYRENLDALTEAGADLVPVSLLDGSPLPPLDGLYIGGGLPEDFAAPLSANTGKRESVLALSRAGLPVYAECGGLIYLCTALHHNGTRYPMAGVFDGETRLVKHPQGLGYVEATVSAPTPFHPLGTSFRGHEFHFSHYTGIPAETPPLTLSRGKGLDMRDGYHRDGLCRGATFACYTHIYAPAVPHWAPAFVGLCRQKMRGRP